MPQYLTIDCSRLQEVEKNKKGETILTILSILFEFSYPFYLFLPVVSTSVFIQTAAIQIRNTSPAPGYPAG